MNEHDQFLEDLKTDQTPGTVDVLDAPLDGSAPAKVAEAEEVEDFEEIDGIKPKNRRERRLLRKLEAERESSIYLSGKLAAREEAKSAVSEERDYLKTVERIYGTDTPEAQLATDLLKKAIVGARDDAKAQALDELRAERKREQDEERESSEQLDGFIEDIEDEYDVSVTEPQKRAFYELLGRMSPKDDSGNVTEYADPRAVWEVFQERLSARKAAPSRAKELSSRSMTQSGASPESNLQDDAAARYLREHGII